MKTSMLTVLLKHTQVQTLTNPTIAAEDKEYEARYKNYEARLKIVEALLDSLDTNTNVHMTHVTAPPMASVVPITPGASMPINMPRS